ncbi:uroporphyrin-3 C-methyltransferase [Dyella jiangningensis]|uniref:uroporphyrinogen-III C-methyltransferase n=1 Tax=Dyella sp. AtDHG13 TaxID=1938897 RepID=UPI00088DA75E|nr:uroporphyrinogen-III C-methyltransferase [Dyella sp. AtDHG13]PXV59174.1 uroporphyrin-3 C-methyltransferase [Dyella sp. AtDHG13]SDK24846.1 uroporphyrin-3 C-methyltransferase [Dyella jiangningensis]
MSQDDSLPDSGASAGARSDTSSRARGTPPARRGSGTLAVALLFSLVALGGAGYVGWRQWQQEQGNAAGNATLAALRQQVDALQGAASAGDSERNLLRQRLSDADQVNRSLREEVLSQAERTRNLEDALAKLSEKTLSGHDAMLLDETESLLRMAKERYDLFHDAQGALSAYALADQALAAVNDGAFSGLRQSMGAEREALGKSRTVNIDASLITLSDLRASMMQLPLKPLDTASGDTAPGGWSRIVGALNNVVKVQRTNGAPLSVADARFARELAAIDLAQAQAALLASDRDGYVAALKRADAGIAAQFDTHAAPVQQARAQLASLMATPPGAPVQLGAALNELRNLRAVHALKPASSSSTGAKP